MYLLARELTGRRDAAFLAGLIFAFSPMRALHVSHLQVLAWGWMPIALWGLHRFLATQHRFADGALRGSTFALAVFVVRVHRSGILEQLFSVLPRASRPRSSLIYELASRSASAADSLPRARPARSGVGAHPCLRRHRGVGVRVGPPSVRIPYGRTTTGRCSAPTCDPMCRPLTTRASGEPCCTATSFPSASCFQVS